jgi:hypothetical protein
MWNYQEQQKAWKPQQSLVNEEPRNLCHNPKAWSLKLNSWLPWEGPLATTIPSRGLSAPSFARILNLKEMDSTTTVFFILNRFYNCILFFQPSWRRQCTSIAAARVGSLRFHLFGLIYPWRRGGSTRGTRCPKHASKPNEKIAVSGTRRWDDSGDGRAQARIDISAIDRRKV